MEKRRWRRAEADLDLVGVEWRKTQVGRQPLLMVRPADRLVEAPLVRQGLWVPPHSAPAHAVNLAESWPSRPEGSGCRL